MTNQTSQPRQTGKGFALAVFSALMLATTAIIIRHLTETYRIPALVLAFWRDVLVTLVLVLILLIFQPRLLKVERRFLPFLAFYGLVFAFFNGLWVESVVLNGAAIATVLSYSSTAFTVLLARWFLKESLNWDKILAVVLSLIGVTLVSGLVDPAAWHTNFVGVLVGVLCGLSYAIYTMMGRSAAQRGVNPWTAILYSFAFATVFLFLFNLVPGKYFVGGTMQVRDLLWLGWDPLAWGIMFLLAVGPTLAGFGVFNVSLGYLPSSVVNLLMCTEPVFVVIFAYVFLKEQLTLVEILGSALIISGVIILRIKEGQMLRKNRPGSAPGVETGETS